MSETLCNRDEMCSWLRDRIVDSGRGFYEITSLDLSSTVGDPKLHFEGVAYRKKASERGLMLSCCPWCRGIPGERMQPANSPGSQRGAGRTT